ncbi:MAG: hypothetical protein C0468_04255 [Planctomyces sp.]|nr:hypothetical protein [Planctomyces sp.]
MNPAASARATAGAAAGPGPGRQALCSAARWDAWAWRALALALVACAGAMLTAPLRDGVRLPAEPQGASAAPAAQGRQPPRFGIPEPPRRAPGAVRVASWNLQDLFLWPESPSDARRASAALPKPDDELHAAARVIRALDADVLALQEVGSLQELEAFRDRYLAGMGYAHAASLDVGDARGIEQAVLSRFPLGGATVWPDAQIGGVHPQHWGPQRHQLAGQPVRFRRGPLRVLVDLPADKTAPRDPSGLILYVVHQKSGPAGAYWRRAEATATAALAAQDARDHPRAHVLVLGDFNAQPSEPGRLEYDPTLWLDPFGGLPQSDPIAITHASGRRIDGVLIWHASGAIAAPGAAFVLGAPAAALANPEPSSADPHERVVGVWGQGPAGWASDHLPVAVDITPAPRRGDAPE